MDPGAVTPTLTWFDLLSFLAVFLVLLIVGGAITDLMERRWPRD